MRQQDLGMVTAYAYAVSQGYTGTEEEFAELMASYATVAEEAAESAAEAAASAEAAGTSEAHAASSAASAGQSATSAGNSAASASGSAVQAQSSATAAGQSATQAAGSATAAGNSATAAAGSASQAAASETAAGASATAAAGSATSASGSATAAAGSATEADASADRAQEILDSIPEDYSEMSEDVADLKSALYQFTSIAPITWTSGGYVGLTGTTIDVTNVTPNTGWMCAVISCTKGDKFIINAYGGNAPRAYGFVDSNGGALERASSQARVTDTVVTAPAGSAYLVINNQNIATSKDYVSYKGAPVADVVAPIKLDVGALQNAMVDVYDKVVTTVGNSAGYLTLRSTITVGDQLRVINNTTQTLAILLRTGSTTVANITDNLAVNASIDFTAPADADMMTTYINSGTTGSVITLNLKSDVPELQKQVVGINAQITDINTVIGDLLTPIEDSISMWEPGRFTYGGNAVSSSDHCRTKTFIDETIESVLLVDTTYQLYVFGWDSSGSCVGFWRPSLNRWENDDNLSMTNCNYVNFAELRKNYTGYKFKLVLGLTGIDISEIADVIKFGHYIPTLGETKRRPMLTFIDDDGYKQGATIWEGIMGECNIPVNVALITANPGVRSYSVTWDDVQRLKNIGFEFISHTHEHIFLGDDTMTSEQVTADFKATIAALNSHNCEPRFVVYPYTTITNANKELVRQYFSCGIALQNLLNEPYIQKDVVHRYDFNSGTENKEIDGQTYEVHKFRTLQSMKDIIDNAVLHNGWIIMMSHLRNTYASDGYYYDSDVKQLILDTVAYARSKNVEIVHVSKGYEMYKDIMK